MNARLVVVTGAAGFLGRHVAAALDANGLAVRGLDRCDRPDGFPGAWQRADMDTVAAGDAVFAGASALIHCAGIANPATCEADPQACLRTNVASVATVLEAARRQEARVVALSSAAVYGPVDRPSREDDALRPVNLYGLSKVMLEQLTEHWRLAHGVSSVTLRVFQAYGAGGLHLGAVGAFLRCRVARQPINLVGDGGQVRDFVHVSDVARAIVAAALGGGAGIYNLGSGRPRTVAELAALIGGPTITLPPRPGEPRMICADMARFAADFGWLPEIGLEEGIAGVLKEAGLGGC